MDPKLAEGIAAKQQQMAEKKRIREEREREALEIS